MESKWQNRVVALAGILQASALVDRVANTGYLPQEEFRTCVESLLKQNPTSTLETFGSLSHLQLGLEVLVDTLNGKRGQASQQSLRYMLGVIYLQQKLGKRRDLMEIISRRIEQAATQARHFDTIHENVVGNLADLYVETVGQFRFRIHVRGEATYLQQQRIANQVRTLLFAGIRSAMLWQQVGGRRWQVLLQRHHLLHEARDLLQTAKASQH